ncbi:MAG: threonine synthase [Chitinispirillaceae bacterium]|nr:threonine synthase [Chitinispirillaceae bacterium]
MRYLSTRHNYDTVTAAQAIALGMVPDGGLFVPATIPAVQELSGGTYHETARTVLAAYLSDFPPASIRYCIDQAYNADTFDTDAIVNVVPLDGKRSVMELWHGPTAAFKDVALQIMPHFLAASKKTTTDNSHTVILVATSGDTGKAALEGFKNCEGISIIVFYPHNGVSEIQKLQMTTTDGSNTHVVAVRGNFDDCQNGVKKLFGSQALRAELALRNCRFSSANSINWGRLCPQIVYYFTSYAALVKNGIIGAGEKVNFCVPTGNFGNILAGFYALAMGLPIAKLICASNKNNVLADFFATGRYDTNRTFHRTMSPSMDILISSNLERFLYEMTGHDAEQVSAWNRSLQETGTFEADSATRARMAGVIEAGWVDEAEVLSTISNEFKRSGYVLDTHTAVAAALCERIDARGLHTIISSTASPYKFSQHVLSAIAGETTTDEFFALQRIARISGMPVHRALSGLRDREIRHTRVIAQDEMEQTVKELLESIDP